MAPERSVTRTPDAHSGIDTEALRDWVLGLDLDAAAPLAFSAIGDGKSNLTFLVVDAEGRRWVLRRPPLGQLLASAHDVAREHRILSALQLTPVPSPDVLGLTRDADGVPLMLMEYVAGTVINSVEAARTFSEGERGQVGLALARALGTVHSVDPDAAGLGDLASRKPYAERQLKRWSSQWEASCTRKQPLVGKLAARLRDAIPEQREVTIVHGDFHLLNVIVDPPAGTVCAILDWELCTLGEPLADLGGLLAYWPQHDDPAIVPDSTPTLSGFPSREELVDAYRAATGRDTSAVGFWHVLGLWKVAIILEGVRRRALDEAGNAQRTGVPSIAMIDGLLERALMEAWRAGI